MYFQTGFLYIKIKLMYTVSPKLMQMPTVRQRISSESYVANYDSIFIISQSYYEALAHTSIMSYVWSMYVEAVVSGADENQSHRCHSTLLLLLYGLSVIYINVNLLIPSSTLVDVKRVKIDFSKQNFWWTHDFDFRIHA